MMQKQECLHEKVRKDSLTNTDRSLVLNQLKRFDCQSV